MDFGIAETGIARGSPPGTTTEVLRFGIPFAEIRVVSRYTDKDLLFQFLGDPGSTDAPSVLPIKPAGLYNQRDRGLGFRPILPTVEPPPTPSSPNPPRDLNTHPWKVLLAHIS
jgi:hypothetical protein